MKLMRIMLLFGMVLFFVLLIDSSSATCVDRTNEYWDSSGADVSSGSKHACCPSEDYCVTTSEKCIGSNTLISSKKWLCLDGKWDKCDSSSKGVTRDMWTCSNGKWSLKTYSSEIPSVIGNTISVTCIKSDRTNEYWDSKDADASPNSIHACCTSSDYCVSIGGKCKKGSSDGVLYFSKTWVCYNGKWDNCDSDSENVVRGKWRCSNGKWVSNSPSLNTPSSPSNKRNDLLEDLYGISRDVFSKNYKYVGKAYVNDACGWAGGGCGSYWLASVFDFVPGDEVIVTCACGAIGVVCFSTFLADYVNICGGRNRLVIKLYLSKVSFMKARVIAIPGCG